MLLGEVLQNNSCKFCWVKNIVYWLTVNLLSDWLSDWQLIDNPWSLLLLIKEQKLDPGLQFGHLSHSKRGALIPYKAFTTFGGKPHRVNDDCMCWQNKSYCCEYRTQRPSLQPSCLPLRVSVLSDELIFRVWSRPSAPKLKTRWYTTRVSVNTSINRRTLASFRAEALKERGTFWKL